jgi:hypothetical protein
MHDTASPPWQLWVIGLLSLVWNGIGAFDYLMKNTRNADYLSRLPPAAVQSLDGLPYWLIGFWTLGVWAAVLGSLLLLLRSRYAIHAFAASLVGLAVNAGYTATGVDPTGQPIGLTVSIWIVAVALLLYALRLRKAGLLR